MCQSLNNVSIIKENKLQKQKLRKKKLLRESLNSDRVDSVRRDLTSINVYVYVSDDFIVRSGGIKSSDFERLSVVT